MLKLKRRNTKNERKRKMLLKGASFNHKKYLLIKLRRSRCEKFSNFISRFMESDNAKMWREETKKKNENITQTNNQKIMMEFLQLRKFFNSLPLKWVSNYRILVEFRVWECLIGCKAFYFAFSTLNNVC